MDEHRAGHALEAGDVRARKVIVRWPVRLGGAVAGVVDVADDLSRALFGLLKFPESWSRLPIAKGDLSDVGGVWPCMREPLGGDALGS